MTERRQVEELLRALHATRLEANLERLCSLFSSDARMRIQGTSDGKPIAIEARGTEQIRPWLSVLVKTFRLRDYRLLSLTIEGERAAAHWQVNIHSKITGAQIPTELVDLIEVRDGRIADYVEFFVPR
ncbi:MAG TPA: nuclear transport factor 2 family protein [Steroidobacteraceae bacterium]|jgi:ketosteroid isomerase-like protein|nr:nuclear transport factor 2 family protein [Steroidobacteraceae bacterium]